MKIWKYQFCVFIFILVSVSSCSLYNKFCKSKPSEIHIFYESAEDLHMVNGEPHNVLVRFYALKEIENFKDGYFLNVWSTPDQFLGADLKLDEINISPGEKNEKSYNEISHPLLSEAKFLGVIAGYRMPKDSNYEHVMKVADLEKGKKYNLVLLTEEIEFKMIK